MPEQPKAFFVYGTLKSGHLRGNAWPCKPLSVEPAIVQANLYDLGPYPAIVPGKGWVLGELWTFLEEDMAETILVLDRVEGYQELGKGNEYERKVVETEVHSVTGAQFQKAFAYFAANPKVAALAKPIEAFRRAFDRPVAAWPGPSSRVPQSFSEE